MMFRFIALPLVVGLLALSPLQAKEQFLLPDNCPAGFEKLADNSCRLVSLYNFYQSPEQHGGVRANLPPQLKRYTPQQIALGKYLFFDPLLSQNKDMSCASCHQPDKGLSDGRKRSLGNREAAGRHEIKRSAPTLWNTGFLELLMWDGRATGLEEQARLPLFSEHEMAMTPEGLEQRLRASKNYPDLFASAWNRLPDIETTAASLAAFQTSLVSLNSRYDRYAHGDQSAMNEQEIRGYNAFRGFVGRCSQCHIPPLFTDGQLAVVGAPENDLGYADPGAGAEIKDPDMQGAFRVPTLRNITKTAPYFHSGQFPSLKEVVEFYNDNRGHAAPAGQKLKIHWHVHMTRGPELSDQDVEDIVTFLHTLEDETTFPKIPKQVPSGLPVTISMEE